MSPHNVCKCERVTKFRTTIYGFSETSYGPITRLLCNKYLRTYMLSNLYCAENFSKMRNSVQSIMCASKKSSFYKNAITRDCSRLCHHTLMSANVKEIPWPTSNYNKNYRKTIHGFSETSCGTITRLLCNKQLKIYMLRNLHCAPKFSSMRTSLQSKISATKKLPF